MAFFKTRAGTKHMASVAVAAALTFGVLPSSNAALILEISDGITTKTIRDGGAGDMAGAAGLVTASGGVGAFFFNITTGSSKPAIGSATEPMLGLNSMDLSGAAGTLTVRLTDTDFSGPVSDSIAYASTFSGITNGKVSLETFIDNNNDEFGLTTKVASLQSSSGGFTTADISNVATSDAFSLTLIAKVEHLGHHGFTNLNALVAVPEPSTLGMVGASLVLVPLARRRNKRKG